MQTTHCICLKRFDRTRQVATSSPAAQAEGRVSVRGGSGVVALSSVHASFSTCLEEEQASPPPPRCCCALNPGFLHAAVSSPVLCNASTRIWSNSVRFGLETGLSQSKAVQSRGESLHTAVSSPFLSLLTYITSTLTTVASTPHDELLRGMLVGGEALAH